MRTLVKASDVTLAKWIEDGTFPAPYILENGHHRWQFGVILDWIDKLVRKSSAAGRAEPEAA